MTHPMTMGAVVTMGHGDLDQMVLHKDWACSTPASGEVLIRVRACGLNNIGSFGSERGDGFADYTITPVRTPLAMPSDFSDAELATFSCSCSTAEEMLTRAQVCADVTVRVPGASGWVGGACPTAKRRGAQVIAMPPDFASLGAPVAEYSA